MATTGLQNVVGSSSSVTPHHVRRKLKARVQGVSTRHCHMLLWLSLSLLLATTNTQASSSSLHMPTATATATSRAIATASTVRSVQLSLKVPPLLLVVMLL